MQNRAERRVPFNFEKVDSFIFNIFQLNGNEKVEAPFLRKGMSFAKLSSFLESSCTKEQDRTFPLNFEKGDSFLLHYLSTKRE